MKKIVTKEVIPVYEITHTTYQCEGCGTETKVPNSIIKCEICDKEICPKCNRYLDVVKDELTYKDDEGDLYLKSDIDPYFNTYTKVCQECYNKLQSKSDTYKVYLRHIIDEFNENLNKLNDKYMKGEL